MFLMITKGWFSLGVDCRRGAKSSLFLYLVLCALAPRLQSTSKENSLNTLALQTSLCLLIFRTSRYKPENMFVYEQQKTSS